MPTAEYSKNPENHRSAVDVAKSYIDVSHERHDKETAGRDYYRVLDKLDSVNNGIEEARKNEYVTFTIGENGSFTEAASVAMFDKNFKELKHNQKNIVLNLYLILASQGLEMNKINKQDVWKLDFKNSVFTVTFGGGKKLTGKLEYLKTTQEREDIINSTRDELAGLKSRLTAEAQAILEGRSGTPEHLQGALETGSLTYILKTLENDNVSYESRAQILKDRAKAFTENPGASGMANEIAGINYYLGQWKVGDQFINPDTGAGYKGTREQNKAWVQVIKDIIKGQVIDGEVQELPVYMQHGYSPAEGVPAPVSSGMRERDAAIIGRERTEGEQLTEEERRAIGEEERTPVEVSTPAPAPEATPEISPETREYAKEFRDAASDAIGRRITLQSMSLSVHQETIDDRGNIAVLIKGKHVEQGGAARDAKVTPLGNLTLTTHYRTEITAREEAARQITLMEPTLAEWEAKAKELDRRYAEEHVPATAEHPESTPEPEVTPSRDKAEFREKLRMHQEQEVAKYVEQVRIYAGNFAEQNGLSAIETKFQKIPSDDVSRNQYQIIFKMGRMREEAVFSLPSAANAMIQLEQGSDKEYYKKDPGKVMTYDFSSEASAGAEVLGALDRLKTKHDRREQRELSPKVNEMLQAVGLNPEAPKDKFERAGLKFDFRDSRNDYISYQAKTQEGYPVVIAIEEGKIVVSFMAPPTEDKKNISTVPIKGKREGHNEDDIKNELNTALRYAQAASRSMAAMGVSPRTGLIDKGKVRRLEKDKEREGKKGEKHKEEMIEGLTALGLSAETVEGGSFELAGVRFTHSIGLPKDPSVSFEGAVRGRSILRITVVDPKENRGIRYKITRRNDLRGEEATTQTEGYKTFKEFKQALEQIRAYQKGIEDMRTPRLLENSPGPGEAHPMEQGFAQALGEIGGNRENYTHSIQLNGIPELTFEYKEFSWTGLERPIPENAPDEPLKGTVNSAYYRAEKDGILYTLRIVDPGESFEDGQFGKQDKAYKLRIVNAPSGTPEGIQFNETQDYDNAGAVFARLREVLGQVEEAKNKTASAPIGESVPPLSDDSPEAEALVAALEENPLPESAQKIIKEVLRIDSGKAPFEFGGFTFNYQGTMGKSEVFYVGDKDRPELKLNINIDKNGVAKIVLGGSKITGGVKSFSNASALESFLNGLEK